MAIADDDLFLAFPLGQHHRLHDMTKLVEQNMLQMIMLVEKICHIAQTLPLSLVHSLLTRELLNHITKRMRAHIHRLDALEHVQGPKDGTALSYARFCISTPF